ncbi:MAG: hypothetical protein ABLT11_12085 [Candidatus Acidiferrum sp.]
MGIRSDWPLVVVMVAPLTLASYGHRLAQSAPTTAQSSAADRHDDTSARILQKADSWRTGDPLPQELRRFRQYGTDIPTASDSDSLIVQVKNSALLAALVVDSGTDSECREEALSRGLEVDGPKQFFNLLRTQLPAAAAKDMQPWINEVRQRMSRRHLVVDALSIEDRDMPRQQALTVIKRVTNDLRTGVPWSKVYERYSEKFSYPPKPDGSQRTKIGLLGHLVIFPDPLLGKGYMANITPRNSKVEVVQWQGPPPPRRLSRLGYFDSAHLPTLLKANVGDVLLLRSQLYREYVLYQVQEIYKGDAENRQR